MFARLLALALTLAIAPVAAAQSFLLTVVRTGTGTGSVASTPAGITCGVDCNETYPNGTPVSLTATPVVGSTFTGWSGACAGTGTCNVLMNSALTVTANFTLNTTMPTLTVSLAGTGTGVVISSPGGISCNPDCVESYALNTPVTLTATGNIGSIFAGWSGACAGMGACNLTMDTSKSATATFTALNAVLTVVHAGTGAAVSTSSPAGINCPGTCNFTFPTNTVVSVASVPAAGTTFTSFSGADSSSGNVASVTMTGNRTLTVNLRCASDFNNSGTLSVQDLFDFLAAYFAGCP